MYASADQMSLKDAPPALLRSIEEVLKSKTTNPSKYEDKCSSLLHQIGFVHEREVSPFGNNTAAAGAFLAIDFACTQQKIAVEYDGSSHYLKSLGSGPVVRAENGPTKAKRRLLQKMGWQVVNVPYFDCPMNGCVRIQLK